MRKEQHIKGLVAAPFTPMKADGSLNTALIPSYYELLKENNVNGAFINGSTGEGVSLTFDEKKQVTEAWAACTRNDASFKLISLLGGNCVSDCIELAKHACEQGLDAVAITSPSYFKPRSVEVLAEICIEIANAVPDMPFYYYHIPVLTGVSFPMYALLQLMDGKTRNFAGVKYTHEDLMDFHSCLGYQNGKYDMLWGRDETMLSALPLGTQGAIGSTFNYAAPIYHQLMDAFNAGDMVTARDLQLKAIRMIELLGKYGGIATGKSYMQLIGLDCGGFRLPVKNMSSNEFTSFKKDTDAIQFDTFRSRMPALSHK
ncbi:MAG: dihydrodipicolinate synthase family protein [Bacteroidota bacterium]